MYVDEASDSPWSVEPDIGIASRSHLTSQFMLRMAFAYSTLRVLLLQTPA